MLEDAGFESVVVEEKPASAAYIKEWLPGSGCEDYVVAANVTAVKPAKVSHSAPMEMASSKAKAVPC